MAIRRSARIRAKGTPEVEDLTPQPVAASRLYSVAEGEETDSSELPHFQTPLRKTPSQKTPRASIQQKRASMRTPTSVTAARPSREEMHPSKAQQSTTKHADLGLLLGFNPIKKDANGNIVKHGISDDTPTKSKASPATDQFGTPGFEYKFHSQETELSNEAKLLMESVRADAARIKAQMVQSNSEQEHEDHKAQQVQEDRKIAMPQGKANRFSDIHMAEFRKMDSIAGHASSFRATPGRFQPVTKSLKRTKSKAQLDEPESQNSSPSRSATKISKLSTPTAATTAKRIKHNQSDDASTRHESKDQTQKVETPRRPAGPRPRPRPRTNIRSSLLTPTHASLARTTSTSIKAPRTSMIPSLRLSPVAKTMASPRTPHTDFNPRLKNKLPTLGSLRSILRQRQPLFSRDPAKIASGTHVAAPDFNPKSLFGGAGDISDSAPTPSPKKHVEFTPSVKSHHELAVASPSPSKASSAQRRSMAGDVVYPTLPALTPEKNSAVLTSSTPTSAIKSIRHVRKSDAGEQPAPYQELPVVTHGIAHGIANKKRHRSEINDEDSPSATNSENVPPIDVQSDERSSKRFKSNPPTPSPVKKRLTKTPVRPSGQNVTPASKKKSRGVLSMSRLNMLSKPKRQA
ncbi:erythromycin esterase [Penicillium digitatum]|nr:erythromycin esterase [Penicillium digitatum]